MFGLLALGGCGFAPIYGGNSAVWGKLAYATDDTVGGFRMRNRLQERLGQTTAPRYVLAVTTTEQRRTAAIAADGDTTRFNVIGTAVWTLKDAATGVQIEAGEVQTFTGYAATGSTTATQAAATDATDRLSVALADMIVSRLLIVSMDIDT